jgi:predicted DNA-binding transcriptional regulator AlpA
MARFHDLATIPTGLRRKDAAAHCGVSPAHFDRMVKEGVLPLPRALGGVNLWLRQELDEALFSIAPADARAGGTSCDAAFKLS